MDFSKKLQLLERGQKGQSDLFYEQNKDYVITSMRGMEGYYYNKDSKLWVELSKSLLLNHVSEFLYNFINDSITELENIIEKTKKQLKKNNKKLDRYNDNDSDNSEGDDEENNNIIKKLQKTNCLLDLNLKDYTELLPRFKKCDKNISSSKHIQGVLDFLIDNYSDVKFMNKLNSSKHILPIRNGRVINLKTLEISERTRDDYFSYELDLDYISKTTQAEKFFLSLMTDDKEKMKVFQRYLGYSITGENNAKCYFVGIGSGDNGKSACFDIFSELFRPFFISVQKDIIFKDKNSRTNIDPYLAELNGKRIGQYNESADNCTMKEDNIKAITGNDSITARPLYRDPFTFTPIIKIWIMTNKKIIFDSCSEPMVKRTRIIKFNSVFTSDKKLLKKPGFYLKDTQFVESLKTMYRDEIFSFIVNGANEYYKQGLDKCESIEKEEHEYIKSIDPIRQYIEDSFELCDKSRIERTEIFSHYIDWCKDTDTKMVKRETLYDRFRSLKFPEVTVRGTIHFKLKYKNDCKKEEEEEEEKPNKKIIKRIEVKKPIEKIEVEKETEKPIKKIEVKKETEKPIKKIEVKKESEKPIKKIKETKSKSKSNNTDSESDIDSDLDSDFDINGDDKFTIDFSMI
jgi:P4 family phage/plasmid primase-like protien